MATTFKKEIITMLTYFAISSVIKFGTSLFILFLFETIANNDYSQAYLYCGIIVALWYLYQLVLNAGYMDTYLLGNNIKTALSMLLYSKIATLSSFDIKNAELGTIINLFANDLSLI